jgi:AcrR family transcriptional regulator
VSRRATAEGAPDVGTRAVILSVASQLFAVHGYHGTTTREIADGVGIRQPSLFHHFSSKAEIMKALLEHDLSRAVGRAERTARADASAPVRLYRYLLDDVTHVATSPYNLAGVYTEEVRASSEFEPWHRKRRRLHRAIERIVADGVASGAFLAFPPLLIREAILGILGRTLGSYSGRQRTFDAAMADQIATLLVRALLTDPSSIDDVRGAAKRLDV